MCQKKKNTIQLQLSATELSSLWSSQRLFQNKMRQLYAEIESKQEKDYGEWIPRWSVPIKAKVGSILLDTLVRSATVRSPRPSTSASTTAAAAAAGPGPGPVPEGALNYEHVPAMWHSIHFSGKKRVGVIKFHNEVIKALEHATNITEVSGLEGGGLPV